MNDFSIMIPQRDYKLIKQAVKKHRYPVEDPSIVGRDYCAENGSARVSVVLANCRGKFYLRWSLGTDNSLIEHVSHDMRSVSFNGRVNAHFDIDPTYE